MDGIKVEERGQKALVFCPNPASSPQRAVSVSSFTAPMALSPLSGAAATTAEAFSFSSPFLQFCVGTAQTRQQADGVHLFPATWVVRRQRGEATESRGGVEGRARAAAWALQGQVNGHPCLPPEQEKFRPSPQRARLEGGRSVGAVSLSWETVSWSAASAKVEVKPKLSNGRDGCACSTFAAEVSLSQLQEPP